MDREILKLYDRWVDDTFVRHKIADRAIIHAEFHSFHKNLEFTMEEATKIQDGERELNFIPVLDIGVYWDPSGSYGCTKCTDDF